MTGAPSIQDVIFFPQMRPEKKQVIDPKEKFLELGIPEEWVNVIQGLGYLTVDSLKEVKPGRLFNDMTSYNKKHKLGLKNPSQDDVKAWLSQLTTHNSKLDTHNS